MAKQVAWRGTNSRGQKVTLLTTAGKGAKYSKELREKVRYTNNGKVKVNKAGEAQPLTNTQRAYRAGYLDARNDSAGAYLSNQAKNGNAAAAAKLKAHKDRTANRRAVGARKG